MGGGCAPTVLVDPARTAQPVLPEGLHPLAIADDPVLTLYVIPILHGRGDHQDYQIVFN